MEPTPQPGSTSSRDEDGTLRPVSQGVHDEEANGRGAKQPRRGDNEATSIRVGEAAVVVAMATVVGLTEVAVLVAGIFKEVVGTTPARTVPLPSALGRSSAHVREALEEDIRMAPEAAHAEQALQLPRQAAHSASAGGRGQAPHPLLHTVVRKALDQLVDSRAALTERADDESCEPEAPELVADGATAVAAAAARLATSTHARLRRGPAAPVMQHVFRASLAGVLTRD